MRPSVLKYSGSRLTLTYSLLPKPIPLCSYSPPAQHVPVYAHGNRIVSPRIPQFATQYHQDFSTQSPKRGAFHHDNVFRTEPARQKMCWDCEATSEREALVCENSECHAILPLDDDVSYFDVLVDGNTAFEVDFATLRKNYLQLQQKVHPDTFVHESVRNRQLADVQSAWLNRAYHTLRNPLLRAKYLLKLKGHPIKEGDSLEDSILLMEILESHEALEDAQKESEVEAIRLENDQRIRDTLADLSRAFLNGNWAEAKQLTIKLQYWYNIQDSTREWSLKTPH
ncbi:molecular chaperone [Dispira parvispora]|uniref:Molecular chaperone n=1 Tax=Dispira parvispora TaxID=1520584 RepID=A0A9W8E311_9FUNG|nr:molecular chaperone [Dispira parvispora]